MLLAECPLLTSATKELHWAALANKPNWTIAPEIIMQTICGQRIIHTTTLLWEWVQAWWWQAGQGWLASRSRRLSRPGKNLKLWLWMRWWSLPNAKAASRDVCHKSSIQRFGLWKSFSRNFGLIPQRLQFSDPKFDVLPYQARPPKCNGVKYLTDWECNVRAWQVGRLQEVVSNWGWRHQAHSQHLFTSSSVSLFSSLSYISSLCRFPLFANVSMSCCVKTEACL